MVETETYRVTLSFLNPSRYFDEARNAVRFIGHDGMFEVHFFVEVGALVEPDKTDASETDYLTAFDRARGSVHDVARKIYGNVRRTEYILTVKDFR